MTKTKQEGYAISGVDARLGKKEMIRYSQRASWWVQSQRGEPRNMAGRKAKLRRQVRRKEAGKKKAAGEDEQATTEKDKDCKEAGLGVVTDRLLNW